MDKIRTVLDLYLASHPQASESIDSQWKRIVADSPLVKNAHELVNDGWGEEYKVSRGNDGEIEILSDKYSEYQANKGQGGLFSKK
jgi:hypothetical protein